jgi:AcrR family transcriptional regulator
MAKRTKKTANPRKAPEQDRSRATVEAMLEAAAHILVKNGYDAFTTNRVAERAGVSIGSLYQYFPNKDALLSELMRRHVAEIERGVEDMAAHARTAPLAEVIRAGIQQNVRSHLVDPELHRVLSEEVPPLGSLDWKVALNQRMATRVRDMLESRRSEIVVGDIELATYILTLTVEAVVHNAVTRQPEALQSGALAEELTRMLVGYLTGKLPVARRPMRTAAE